MHGNAAGERPDPDHITTRAEFAAGLTALRDRAGLTVREVARRSKLPVSTLGDYFGGAHLPPVGQPQALAAVLAACGVTDEQELERWRESLRRVRRSPGRRAAGAPSPYRGLSTFESTEAEWFFGRERLTALLLNQVEQVRHRGGGLLVVVGPSGAGKSSLLNAGLVAGLRAAEPDADSVRVGRPSSTGLPELSAIPSGTVFVLDQCEEIFTALPAGTSPGEYLAALRALVWEDEKPRGVTLVLGLRADFSGHLMRDAFLAQAMQSAQIVVGPMTDEELRRAVVEPARKARATVEEGLVEVLAHDFAPGWSGSAAAHDPGALPLLSHALLATWESGGSHDLTIRGYRQTGGVHGAVAATAEEVYTNLTPAEQDLARRIFLRLVTVTDDGPDTRRRIDRSDLLREDATVSPAAVADVLDRFVENRLITVDVDVVSITHEAVLSAWPRLGEWIAADRAGLRIRRLLDEAAVAWDREGRENGLLYTGARLSAAREWTDAGHRAELGELSEEFLALSIRRQRRKTRRLYQTIAGLTALLVLATSASIVAYQQRSINITERNLALSRLVASHAEQVRQRDPALAMQLSLVAYRVAKTAEARASLLDSSATEMPTRLLASSGVLQAVAVSPDGSTLVAAGVDGRLYLWDLSGPRPRRVDGPGFPFEQIFALAFTPDGRFLAAAGAKGVVHRWSLDGPALLTPVKPDLTGPKGLLYGLDFNRDGTLLAAGGVDRQVHLWRIGSQTSDHLAALTGPAGYVQAVRFSPDGRTLAAGGEDKTVWRWDVSDPGHARAEGAVLTGFGQRVYSVAFSPDGRTLAAGSAEGLTQLLDLTGQRPTVRIGPGGTAPSSWINALAFSPDGPTLAMACADGQIWLWDTRRAAFTRTLPHPGPVTAIGFTADGQRLASSAADGQVRIWRLAGPTIPAGRTTINGLAISPDGRTLAVGSDGLQAGPIADRYGPPIQPAATDFVGALAFTNDSSMLIASARDGTARWWRTTDPPTPVGDPLPLHSALIETIAIGPTGQLMATGANDNVVRLWDIADPLHPRSLFTSASFKSYVYSVAFSQDGRLLAAASTDDTVRVWDIRTPAAPIEQARLTFDTYALAVAFAPDSRTLAVGTADRTLWLYNVVDETHIQRYGRGLPGPTSYVYALSYAPDGRTLAAANTDGSVWLWNTADPAHPQVLATLNAADQALYSVWFHPDGRTLAAGGAGRQVWLWDTDTDEVAAKICAVAGDPITIAEWNQYATGLPYDPPC